MAGILVVTATRADDKLVNRLLAYLKDWEYGAGYSFKVLRTYNRVEIDADDDDYDRKPDEPPIGNFSNNEWEGNSISQVEEIMSRNDTSRGHIRLFLMLDDEGVRDGSIIVAERASEDFDNKIKYLKRFNKVRVPWIEAYVMWCNLSISNMNFIEFCIEDEERELKDADYWAHYRHGTMSQVFRESAEKAEALIKELQQSGQA